MTDIIQVVKGHVDPAKITVFGVVRNEMFYLPAFFEHYRGLGIRQFLMLDDRSDDGTEEFLRQQPDCVLFKSPLTYGERVNDQRAGHLWKNLIPQSHLMNQWAICADADEFLFLPPQFSTVQEFTQALDAKGITAVSGSMVDFYPETISEMENGSFPASCPEMFARYPWFDVGPYFRWSRAGDRQIVLHGGVRERLMRQYGVSKRGHDKSGLTALAHGLKVLLGLDRNFKSIGKVPLVRWEQGMHYPHSHKLDRPPHPELQLAIAHMKFTGVLYKKIEAAIASKAYSKGSRAYYAYAALLDKMKEKGGTFLYSGSRRFAGAQGFADAGLVNDIGLKPVKLS